MKKLYYTFAFFLMLITGKTTGQEKKDTTSLISAFKKGTVAGNFRLFYMSTDNDGPLTDYYAFAFGGGLKYQTKSFKGVQLGIGGFFIWNLASSDLTKPDELTGMMNRYEIGQFDVTNPSNKKDMQRLEDFFIKYNFKKSSIKFGKQLIKTPFINPQDGRMRPNGEQGFWTEINELKKTKIEIGWLTHISPRGTLIWYRGASSIGIYPTGLAISGEKSNYYNSLDSKGTAIAGIAYSLTQKIKLQAWDNWVENIFNTMLLQADGEFPIGKNKKITAALQYIHQNALKDGGNTDPAKTYFDPTQTVNIFGASAGYRVKNSFVKLNYSRITKDGRFLFPREWGREPLFTFLPRERNEGLGDVHAFSINTGRDFFDQRLNTEIGAGYYKVPDVKNYRLNKYGLPSYYQFNFSARYSFDGLLNGFNMELLYLYKLSSGNVYNNWKYVFNKVDMQQFNLILNFTF